MSNMQFDIKDIFSKTGSKHVGDEVTVIDSEWVLSRFMTPDSDLDKIDRTNRYTTTASRKFVDTKLGGNIPINPKPQFTRYCDIKAKTKVSSSEVTVSNTNGDYGMGRYYSEAIDDNQQVVFLTFGQAKFNGLIDFFTKAVDYEDSVLANTGRSPLGYRTGQVLGAGIMLAAFPLITISIWIAKTVSKLITGNEIFSYYYMEPNMSLYWGTVNNMVTTLATEMGILIPELMPDSASAGLVGVPVKINQEDLDALGDILPGIINKDTNYIDVFAIATRAQSIANQRLLLEKEMYDAGKVSEYDVEGMINASTGTDNLKGGSLSSKINYYTSFQTFLNKIKDTGIYADKVEESYNANKSEIVPEAPKPTDQLAKDVKIKKTDKGEYQVDLSKDSDYLEKYVKALDASVRDGAHYACFAVDYTGPVSESFSNTTSQIGTGTTLKQVGGKARDIRFDLAGGNIADSLNQITSAAGDILRGALNSVSFGLDSVVATLTGGAFIDLPEKWEDSDTSFPSITYNMELRSPYGNTISQLQNLYIPLCMILSGVLPLATGKSSYTSPFLCSLYCKGIQKTRMGVITDVTISRGEGNLGFNKQWKPLALNVSFKVKDLSSLIAAPVSSSVFSVFSAALDDQSPLSTYLATLASRDLHTDKYYFRKLKLKVSRALMKTDQMISPAAWGLRTGESLNFILGGLAADHSLSLNHQN